MNTKLKIICTGRATVVELDGKSIGKGIEGIKFSHNANDNESPRLTIDLNLKDFSFFPDGYFTQVEDKLKAEDPPADLFNGRA